MMLCNLLEGKPLFAMFASICFFYLFTIGKTIGHNICKNMVFLLKVEKILKGSPNSIPSPSPS